METNHHVSAYHTNTIITQTNSSKLAYLLPLIEGALVSNVTRFSLLTQFIYSDLPKIGHVVPLRVL
jgi:hypothetical protein